jgi:dihydropteroate synthase
MGVINRSPESKNRDVYADTAVRALEMAERYRELGVAVIDLGGQSTNYENPDIGVAEEVRRLIPTVELLAQDGFVVSVDTWKPAVAVQAAAAGAALINDTGGLKDPDMVAAVAEAGIPAVLMYLEADLPNDARGYDTDEGKTARIRSWMQEQIAALARRGVPQVIVDPGIAISYRTDYDAYTRVQFEVAANLNRLGDLGAPVLYAVPRKDDRYRNVALAALAMHNGADMLRIHDVSEIADIADLMGRLSTVGRGAIDHPHSAGTHA